jgi:hypothetical protein
MVFLYTDDVKKICPSTPSSLGLIVHESFILPSKEEGINVKKKIENVNEDHLLVGEMSHILVGEMSHLLVGEMSHLLVGEMSQGLLLSTCSLI